MNVKYVIQRTNTETKETTYLSPGKVNWVTEEAHRKYLTKYGKWVLGEAEAISANLNKERNPLFTHVPLPERNHR